MTKIAVADDIDKALKWLSQLLLTDCFSRARWAQRPSSHGPPCQRVVNQSHPDSPNCHRTVTRWWLTLASLFVSFKKPPTQRSSWSGSEAWWAAINPYFSAISCYQSLAFYTLGTQVLCSVTAAHGRFVQTGCFSNIIHCVLFKFHEQMDHTCCSRSKNIKIRSLGVWDSMVAAWHPTVRWCAQFFFEWSYALWNRVFHCPNADTFWEAWKNVFYSF